MGKPPPSPEGQEETQDAKVERESFARFVLDWHLRKGLKTALLDVGAAVPDILREFLADWREAELLWMFQVFVCVSVRERSRSAQRATAWERGNTNRVGARQEEE